MTSKINNSLEKIQEGQGSKFDSGVASLERMHTEMVKANMFSGEFSLRGMQSWFASLKNLERELFPYLDAESLTAIGKKRLSKLPSSSKLLHFYFNKLDAYDKELRLVHASKGFGLNNNTGDIGSALEEDMF